MNKLNERIVKAHFDEQQLYIQVKVGRAKIFRRTNGVGKILRN